MSSRSAWCRCCKLSSSSLCWVRSSSSFRTWAVAWREGDGVEGLSGCLGRPSSPHGTPSHQLCLEAAAPLPLTWASSSASWA